MYDFVWLESALSREYKRYINKVLIIVLLLFQKAYNFPFKYFRQI